ncbi:hypothetical protein ACFSKL_07645 [Belliella marina]|uniref:DUF8202 domain-containing protein n=1 Tax=Belliella marina TaxID=1644146 RepID=A0ABW4VM84_9BACT
MKKLYNLKIGFVTALFFSVLTSAFGQSPGGVSTGLAAWYKGDVGLAGTFWADQSGNAYNLERTSAPVGESLINFNPVASFGGVTAHQFNNLTPKILWPVGNTTPTTYYYVAKNNAATANRAVFGIGASNDATGFHSGQQATTGTIATRGVVTFANNTGTAMVPAPPNWDITQPNQGLNLVRTGYDGGGATGRNYIAAQSLAEVINATNVSPTYANNAAFRIGSSGANSVFWSGDVAEVVVFSGKHDPAEYNKVETYLALKYGISKQGDYVDANDNVLYSDATYNNNISGIGRDDASGLHQKQAMSQNTGNQVLISNGSSLFDTNAGNTNDLVDGQFLVWGDNGLQKQLAESLTHNAPGGETNFRFGAIWKAQNTNGVGQVTVAWPAGITNLHLVRSTDATIDATDEFIPMTNVVTVNGVDYNTATVTFNDGDYFTFAGYMMAPGGVAGQGFWVRSDMAGDIATAWQDHSTNADDIPALGTWALSTADGAHNFHPYTTDYTTSKNFYNSNTLLNPGGGDNTTSYSMFSSVRPTSTGTGRITGMGTTGGTTYGSNPSLASSAGTPRFYDFDATTTSEVFSTPFTINTTNLFSAVADNSIANGGGSSFSGGELTLGLNGAYEGFTYNNSNLFQFNGPYLRVGYSTFGTGAGVFPGDIMEVIWYSRALTPNEQSRVNSYLAIKNGVTLSEDYLNSDSDVVFSLTANTGYTENIFGLGFNAVSGLTQRQAKSINEGQELIIGAGNSLFDNNADNTNDLTEGQFLMTGDNGLMQGLSVPLAYLAGSNGETNFRFESIWKVQNTANVGTVTVAWPVGVGNMYLVRSIDETFDDSDDFIPMDDVVSINGQGYNTATITFSDGDFFTFAGYTHAPGGVGAGLEAWHRADAFVYTDAGVTLAASGQTIEQWSEFNSSGIDFSQPTAARRPIYTPEVMLNFNPSVRFTRSSVQWLSYTFPISTPKTEGTLYFTGRDNTVGYGSGILGMDVTMDYPGWHRMAGNNYLIYHNNFTPELSNPIASEIPNIMGASWLNGAGSTASNLLFSTRYNGFVETFNTVSNISLSTNHYRIGQDTNYGAYDGNIGETVYYSRDLDGNEKDRVDSYMGIKYGVTLREDDFETGTFNYLSSSSTVIWDGTNNATYHNNVFGIANDFASALHQKQSKSANPSQRLIIGAGTSLAESNLENTNSLTDGQFLIVGDNNERQSLIIPLVYTAGTNGETNLRFEAVWKVQNTNNVGTVTLAWPVGLSNMYLVRSTDEIFDDTDDFVPMEDVISINGQDYNTASITFNDGDYFTFAAYGVGPGGVVNNLSYWYRADIDAENTGVGSDVTSWTDVFTGTVVSQLGTNAFPKFIEGDVDYFNFNAGINFTAGNQSLGNINVQTIYDLEFDIITLTKEGIINPGSNGRIFSSLVDNNLPAGSISRWDGIGLNADQRLERVNNSYGARYLANPGGITYSTTIPSIMYQTFTDLTLSKGLNGNTNGANGTHGARGFMNGGHAFGDTRFSSNGSDNGGFTGHLGETIIYGHGNLTETERRRVDSYLAIKYGITLSRLESLNYLSSTEETVWDGVNSTEFNNNVFGIARDDIGLLSQKVSTSVNPAAKGMLIVATTNDFTAPNTNTERTAFGEDHTFIMFGDNAVTGETEADTDPCTGLPLDPAITRANKVWRVETTGNPEPIWLQADLNDYTFNSSIEIWVADDENFSTNLVRLPAASYTGGTASFNFLFTEGVKYMTFAGIVSPSDCDVCTGGTFVFKTGASWNTALERQNNVMDPETIGSTDLGDLIVNMSADFPAGIEYRPNAYPRRYGRWFLSRRRDNQNVEVSHNISLNQTVAGASFQISNINTYLNNANKFTVIGYDCDDNVVMPKITNAANPSNATTYEIQGNQVIGTKRYRGLTFLHSTANVRFNRPIERIEIIFDVERVNARQTLRSLDIGDISFECAIPLPPTVDNVTMIQDFTQSEDVPSCIETTMRMRFINSNCDTRTLDISQSLPSGLEFVDDTYNDSEFGSPTPYTFDANTFTLNGLELPSGTTFLYINVRSTDGTTTVYNTSSDYTVTETSNSYSSINPAAGEFSTVGFVASNFTEPDLDLLYEVDATCVDEGGQVTYTLNFDNHDPEITGASLKVYYDIGQEIVSVDFNNGTSGTLGFDPVGDSYIEIDDLVIPAGQSSITVVLDITNEIFTDEDFVSSVFELIVDPDNPCAEELPMTSNEVVLGACTCIEPPSDCDVCTGGTFVFKTGNSWNTSLERINNVMDPEIIGTTDQGDLIVDMSADFPAGIEYRPDSHPRPYGRWFLSRRRDNQNVEVVHSINLNQTVAGASFQISNINTYLRNASKFTIIGYDCDDIEVLPKITNAANPSSRTTYEIQGNQVIGNKRYRGLSYLHSTANVHFERAIERIEIVFDVERVNARQTLRSLDIGDITFECLISLPPNADNVYMVQDFANSEDVPTCLETTMRMRFINNNCEPQTIDITQTLPSGLEFVEDTYNDSEFETPPAYTYNANTFTLNGLELMPGTNYLYINVRSTDGTTTAYNTSSDYTITETSNSYSSVNPSGDEFSTIGFEASSFTAPDLNFLYEVDATCLAEGDQVTYTLNFDNQDPEITGAILKVYYDLGQDITSVTFNNGTSGVLGFDPIGESYIEIDDLVIPTGESSITVTLDITNEIFTDEADASSFFELIVDPDNICSVENPSMLSNVIILEACLGVDPELCTEEVEGNTFSSDGGVPITFNQPATNYGFQFDIHALDNSFNMEINGVQLATQEIEFQSAGTSGINVQFADGDEYETNTAPIWQLKGTASAPLIRVVIAPNGDVSMYGSKTSGGELHLLELSNGNSFNAITWNDGAPNTIIATQSVVGVTYIYGRGSGLNIVPCPDTFCTQPGADGTPAEFTRVGVSDRIGMPANWPANIPNGFIAIESENKGFVITRLTTVQIDALDAVEGMLVYDTDEECIKLYNGTDWNCIVRSCND